MANADILSMPIGATATATWTHTARPVRACWLRGINGVFASGGQITNIRVGQNRLNFGAGNMEFSALDVLNQTNAYVDARIPILPGDEILIAGTNDGGAVWASTMAMLDPMTEDEQAAVSAAAARSTDRGVTGLFIGMGRIAIPAATTSTFNTATSYVMPRGLGRLVVEPVTAGTVQGNLLVSRIQVDSTELHVAQQGVPANVDIAHFAPGSFTMAGARHVSYVAQNVPVQVAIQNTTIGPLTVGVYWVGGNTPLRAGQ